MFVTLMAMRASSSEHLWRSSPSTAPVAPVSVAMNGDGDRDRVAIAATSSAAGANDDVSSLAFSFTLTASFHHVESIW